MKRLLMALALSVLALGALSQTSDEHEDPSGYYTCSMHEDVHEHSPGQCPVCNMNLSLVTPAPATPTPTPTPKPTHKAVTHTPTPKPTPMSTATSTSTATATATPVAPLNLDDPHSGHGHAPDDIAYYTCSMHTFVRQPGPGTCPVCSMNLTPVTQEEVTTGIIRIDSDRRQLIGVRTGPVERRGASRTIRAVGKVRYDETQLVDVSLKYAGWIRTLRVNKPGQPVKKGQTMFTIYSPELYATQEEFLATRAASKPLRSAARRRLRLWDISNAQIDRIERTGRPLEALPILAPANGYVVEKNVVEGTAVRAGQTLFRIAKLDRVWVEADVYQPDLALTHAGQPVRVTLAHERADPIEGEVSFVYPYLVESTRSGRVRVELDNAELRLKPDMYVNVELTTDIGERLWVPTSAVLYVGPRRLVFIDLGEGRLQPREIEIGIKAGDYYEVTKGLADDAVVVVSGNFLVAAESRVKSATGGW